MTVIDNRQHLTAIPVCDIPQDQNFVIGIGWGTLSTQTSCTFVDKILRIHNRAKWPYCHLKWLYLRSLKLVLHGYDLPDVIYLWEALVVFDSNSGRLRVYHGQRVAEDPMAAWTTKVAPKYAYSEPINSKDAEDVFRWRGILDTNRCADHERNPTLGSQRYTRPFWGPNGVEHSSFDLNAKSKGPQKNPSITMHPQ